MGRLPKTPNSEGFVFAATGEKYTILARRAARSLRSVMANVQVDLFTDQQVDDPVFDQIHTIEGTSKRPKMEALRRARFDKTIYLDCDIVVVANMSDIFVLLERFELVAAHENYRNSPSSRRVYRGQIPPAFPEMNSGVIGLQKSAKMQEAMAQWEAAFLASKLRWDQPILRHMLYHGDIQFSVLPMDYNLMHTRFVNSMGKLMAAPRMLHITRAHNDSYPVGDPNEPYDLSVWLSAKLIEKLDRQIAADHSLQINFEALNPPGKTQLSWRRSRGLRARLARFLKRKFT